MADPASEVIIFDLENSVGPLGWHQGGNIGFGQDGKLYIAVGDDKNGANSQSFSTLFGKILRLNSDGSIPSDNPFFLTTTGKNRAIWALGLRNPYSFAFAKLTASACSSTTSARKHGKSSIEASRAQTTVGPTLKA